MRNRFGKLEEEGVPVEQDRVAFDVRRSLGRVDQTERADVDPAGQRRLAGTDQAQLDLHGPSHFVGPGLGGRDGRSERPVLERVGLQPRPVAIDLEGDDERAIGVLGQLRTAGPGRSEQCHGLYLARQKAADPEPGDRTEPRKQRTT